MIENIFIINAHWHNRGDEAANRAMLDELRKQFPLSNITIQYNTFPIYEMDLLIKSKISVLENRFPCSRDLVEVFLLWISKGKWGWSKQGKEFIYEIRNADVVIHAPGGPAIGDIYSNAEYAYLFRLLLTKRLGKKYFFYAPSMGPFHNKLRNILRRYILSTASGITFREEISGNYFDKLIPKKKYKVTLDAAFQNAIDMKKNEELFDLYDELKMFMRKYKKIVGITITDLQWNPLYKEKVETGQKITCCFNNFIDWLVLNGYGIVFIPQLFGVQNDYNYMNSFLREGTLIIDDKHDSYFQQYLISKLYAVVGMRYHSNIFSCKMGTPFVSISYEQKMEGFMKKVSLANYCINIEDLDEEILIRKFNDLVRDYHSYSNYLKDLRVELKQKSAETTDYLLNIMKNNAI